MKYKTVKEEDFQRYDSMYIDEEFIDEYIKMLSHENCYCINATIYYEIEVFSSLKPNITFEDVRKEIFSLPTEILKEYNCKRDFYPFFNSSTMISANKLLKEINEEIQKINPHLQVSHDIELYAVNKFDVDRTKNADEYCVLNRYKEMYDNQKIDKFCIENDMLDLLQSKCNVALNPFNDYIEDVDNDPVYVNEFKKYQDAFKIVTNAIFRKQESECA